MAEEICCVILETFVTKGVAERRKERDATICRKRPVWESAELKKWSF